ncbi:ABC transporter permease [Prosthecochloris sp. ZM]|uniref:ABC transporter permease n=1 Tax=Prosthecochloris sp. ZM TaxID=2283143 RepID=UPI000DF846C7|nr:ABC transporter permease [Prosthecochloris sp. ZM]RDD30256.1 ABC transporter permease [Prosthecochloris sp. ZM]
MQKKIFTALSPLLAVAVALAFSAILVIATGRDPLFLFSKMLRMTFGSDYGTGQIVFRTTSLILTGLAVAIPFRLRLFNIGGEGQALAGAFSAAAAGILIPEGTPAMVAITICTVAAAAGGGLLGLFAGWLKVRYEVNEVISTIMLNFIVLAFVSYMLTNHLALPSTAHTPDISAAARIPGFGASIGIWQKSPANLSTLLVLAICLCTYVVIFKTRFGYAMRAVGLKPDAASYAGIRTNTHLLTAMAAGGAAAGLAAANIVLGYRHCFEAGLTSGIGFTGIAVALLAFAHPLLIVLSALLFGFLEYGGLSINAYVPKDIFMIGQAVTIILIIVLTQQAKRA